MEEKDELYRLNVRRSRDKKYIFASSGSSTTTEQRYLPANEPTGEWKPILGRKEGREYHAEHRDGKFYVRTNDGGATNFKIETYAVGASKPEGRLVSYDPDVYVTGHSLFKDFAVISEREGGVPYLRVIDFGSNQSHRVEFPEPIYSARLGANPEFDTTAVQISYTSFITPNSVYEYDLKTRERKLLKRTEVPAGHNPDDYAVERVTATSHDGVKVPISLFTRKGFKRDGTAPCLLYGYGSYGANTDVNFDPVTLSLLDRGVVFAMAHIRGSSDLGRTWYDDGKMMKKRNTFFDFAACADTLVNEKICSRDRLAIQGGSAGGLLVGATINLRPDLCKAAVLEVPFVDVVNTMLDESLPLTVQEFLEWGNPKKPDEFAYIRTYCPYTNIAKSKYPAMLVTTSLNDSQVAYHEPAKYVAKMRATNPDATILFKCNMDAGHGGASGRYDRLKERALVMAFVLDLLGDNVLDRLPLRERLGVLRRRGNVDFRRLRLANPISSRDASDARRPLCLCRTGVDAVSARLLDRLGIGGRLLVAVAESSASQAQPLRRPLDRRVRVRTDAATFAVASDQQRTVDCDRRGRRLLDFRPLRDESRHMAEDACEAQRRRSRS
jgi:oligopeptidase B